MPIEIPEVVIDRLPVYARALAQLIAENQEVVSSQELGARLRVTPAQIRKDLSYFGRFGKQGRGYNVSRLLGQLQSILGLDRQWRMVLVGVGNLGRAIISYNGFRPQGFEIVEAFDADPEIIGQKVNGLVVRDVANLKEALLKSPADIGIVAVPGRLAQDVVNSLTECGVRAILNYAATTAQVPGTVHIKHIDPVLALQSMTFYIKDASRVPVSK